MFYLLCHCAHHSLFTVETMAQAHEAAKDVLNAKTIAHSK